MTDTNKWVKSLSPEEKQAWLAKRRATHQMTSRSLDAAKTKLARIQERLEWESQENPPRSWRAEKHRRGNLDWEKRNPGRTKELHYKRRYGIDNIRFQELLAAQDGKCGMCKMPHEPSDQQTGLDVDHDHSTNRVRGLLCQRCNKGLGLLQDSIEVLLAGIEYLRRAESNLK